MREARKRFIERAFFSIRIVTNLWLNQNGNLFWTGKAVDNRQSLGYNKIII